MNWNAKEIALLKKLWPAGQSTAQISHRLGYSRNAVCAKLLHMGLRRDHHKPPTANPKIIAACHRPVEKVMSQKPATRQPNQFTKRQPYARAQKCATS